MRFVSLRSLLRASKARQRRSFSPLKNSCGSILKKKIFTFLETLFSKTHKNRLNLERERSVHDINPEISSVGIARCAFRFFVFTFIYIQSASKMVNSRMHSLTFTRIFYSKSSLVSTHKKSFRADNTREIQHESRRKAGGNLHLRSAVVDLRVQLVGAFTFLLFMCA